MAGLKRKRSTTRPALRSDAESSQGSASDYEIVADRHSVDISSNLATVDRAESDDDVEDLIRSQREKHNVRAGAKAVKRAVKGQSRQGTSAVGGGSFQSMGECHGMRTRATQLTISAQAFTLLYCVHSLYADTKHRRRFSVHPYLPYSLHLQEIWWEWLGLDLARRWRTWSLFCRG